MASYWGLGFQEPKGLRAASTNSIRICVFVRTPVAFNYNMHQEPDSGVDPLGLETSDGKTGPDCGGPGED